MGDVTGGQIKLLSFCIVFYILFSFFGYVFATGIAPTNQTSVGGITLQDVGVPTGSLYTSTPQIMENNGTWSPDFNLGAGSDQDTFRTHWVNNVPVNDSYITICNKGTVFWFIPTWFNDFWNNSNVYTNMIYLNVSYIVNNFDVSHNYTKIAWRIFADTATPNRDFYAFIADFDPLRNNMTAAIYVDHKIVMTLAKGIVTPTAANFVDYLNWLTGILTLQNTWGLSNIPIFNIILWCMTVLTGFAIASVLKSLFTGWL